MAVTAALTLVAASSAYSVADRADIAVANAATQSMWLRVDANAARVAAALGNATARHDYGSFQWLSASAAQMGALRAAGVKFTAVEDAFVLDLGGTRFDPLVSPPAPRAVENDEVADFHLVQLDGPTRNGLLQALAAEGLEPVQYIHPFTYVVWGKGSDMGRAGSVPGVRWTGQFLPEYRVQAQQRVYNAATRPTMALISRHAEQSQLVAALTDAGATVHDVTPVDRHTGVVHLDIAGDRYMALAAIPGVYAIQSIPQDAGPRSEMSQQSIVGAYGPPPTNTIVPGYLDWLAGTGYDGSGVIVGIVDGGVRISHQDFAGNISPCVSAGGSPTSCTHANDGHGTHVAGAVAGSGATGTLLNGFLRGQGVAPAAKVVEQRYPSFLGGGPGGMIPNGMLTIYKESSLGSAVLTNNSWGPSGSPLGYDIPTQQIDIVARDANPDIAGNQPVLNVWSIMNGGGDGGGACAPSSLGSPDEAKNLFAVGSTKLQNNGGAQLAPIFDISSNSAHGNACDGRRVPHIVAPGCSTDSVGSSSDTAHAAGFCGTSMASPVVSGAVALFVEKYRDENEGATPSPALIKATFTAVAQDLQGFLNADNGVMGHRPDRFQGYGRIDLDAVMNHANPVFSIDQTEVFDGTGDTWTQSLTAADPAQPIHIMLAWSDAKGHGLGGTTPAWVNNLDLSVTGTGGTFLGNVVGTDGWSATGGAADDRNNLEGVFLQPAQHGGAVAITVGATNITADALNPFTPGAPAQDFALVCYNCVAEGGGDAEANLGLSLEDAPDPVQIGGTLTYDARIANFGPDAASGITFELDLPEGVTYITNRSIDVPAGGALWACEAVDATVACTIADSIANAAFAPVLEIDVTIDGDTLPGIVDATGTVIGAETDPDDANNTVTVSTEIVGEPDVLFATGFECGVDAPGCAP
jgi:serine protease AprX